MIKEEEQSYTIETNPQMARTMLHDAINDLLLYPSGSTPWRCAEIWMFRECEDEGEGFVSLNLVCDMLDLNIDKVRARVNMCLDGNKRRLLVSEMDRFIDECYMS